DTHEGGYIILALTNDFLYFNEEKSLLAAKKYAEYLINKKVTVIAGLDEAFLCLYQATGERKYVDYCVNEFGLKKFHFRDLQQSRHVYGYIERALMQLKLNEIEPDEKLLYKPHVAVEFLVNLDALDIIGGSGMWEHFNTSHEGHDCNAETCATAHIIWLMSALLRAEGNSFYGDIMERSLYNALFAAFSPTGDRIRYFTDYESVKEYYPSDTFCCPNNFRRMIASLPQLIYYQSATGVVVNLYNQSSASFEIKNQHIKIIQETDYPSSGDVKIVLDLEKACEFDIKLRIPLWSKKVSIRVNGLAIKAEPEPGTFCTIARTWKKGDEIQLSMPMTYRFVRGRGKQWDKVALMRGPVVYGISNKSNPFIKEKMELRIDPKTISEPLKDDSYRPGGLKCKVLVADKNKTEITFTEFIDPSGIKTFFYLSEASNLVEDDELVAKLY
ncbi:glycoside hydrolase family 127 protein, partial [candidate division KSB1 bacterium]|nr:glycoside hydrolase family 127 protein [candidate division KSB1 bacterium]